MQRKFANRSIRFLVSPQTGATITRRYQLATAVFEHATASWPCHRRIRVLPGVAHGTATTSAHGWGSSPATPGLQKALDQVL